MTSITGAAVPGPGGRGAPPGICTVGWSCISLISALPARRGRGRTTTATAAGGNHDRGITATAATRWAITAATATGEEAAAAATAAARRAIRADDLRDDRVA